MRTRKIIVLIIVIILVAIVIAMIMLSPGKVKQFTNEDGLIVKNSISEKTFVDINGCRMGMFIRGKNKNNPVLLFLHGGPGMPEYFLDEPYPMGLDDKFTVVWWDRRGSGLSYSSKTKKEELTAEKALEDITAVTNYLRQRFSANKIYLMAHSYGTFLGIQAAKRNPDLYYAYIGVSQFSNQRQSEKIAYDYMLKYYNEKNDKSMLKKLKDAGNINSDKYLSLRDSAMHEAGIGTMHNMRSVAKGIFLESLLNKSYTVKEKIDLWRGRIFCSKTDLSEKAWKIDLTKEITSVDIPVYFFSGKYDYTVNYSLAEEYLKKIKAPVKGYYLFENSAHSPIFEEQDRVKKIMNKDVLNLKNDMADVK